MLGKTFAKKNSCRSFGATIFQSPQQSCHLRSCSRPSPPLQRTPTTPPAPVRPQPSNRPLKCIATPFYSTKRPNCPASAVGLPPATSIPAHPLGHEPPSLNPHPLAVLSGMGPQLRHTEEWLHGAPTARPATEEFYVFGGRRRATVSRGNKRCLNFAIPSHDCATTQCNSDMWRLAMGYGRAPHRPPSTTSNISCSHAALKRCTSMWRAPSSGRPHLQRVDALLTLAVLLRREAVAEAAVGAQHQRVHTVLALAPLHVLHPREQRRDALEVIPLLPHLPHVVLAHAPQPLQVYLPVGHLVLLRDHVHHPFGHATQQRRGHRLRRQRPLGRGLWGRLVVRGPEACKNPTNGDRNAQPEYSKRSARINRACSGGHVCRQPMLNPRGSNAAELKPPLSTKRVLEESGGRVRNQKFVYQKMAQINFSFCKFYCLRQGTSKSDD